MGLGLLITGAAVLIAAVILFAVLSKAMTGGRRRAYDRDDDAVMPAIWLLGGTNDISGEAGSSGSDGNSSNSDGGGGGGGSD